MLEQNPVLSEVPQVPVQESSGPQNVETSEPLVIPAGDTPASWDDLESAAPRGGKNAKQEEKEAKAEAKAEAAKQEAIKFLKLKSGDKTLDIDSTALVPVKVDGKIVEVPIQEAINRYSQQSHLDQLYKTYKSDKDTFEKERQSISEALNKSYDYLVNQKDLRGFLEYLGEAMGVDANTLYQEQVQKIEAQLQEYQQLTPEERKLREVESENAYWRKKADAQKAAQTQAKSQKALESQVDALLQSNEMTRADLVSAYDELTKAGHDMSQATPEFLVAYHQNQQKINFIESELKNIDPALSSNQEIITNLATHAIQTEATREEIAEVIKTLYAQTSAKKVSEKVKKTTKASKSSEPKASPKLADIWSFDHL